MPFGRTLDVGGIESAVRNLAVRAVIPGAMGPDVLAGRVSQVQIRLVLRSVGARALDES